MTKRQKIMHAFMILELLATDEDGEVCAVHDKLLIGGYNIDPFSEHGKMLLNLGFHYNDEGWFCFT